MAAGWLPLSSSLHGSLLTDTSRHGINLLPRGRSLFGDNRGFSKHAAAFRTFRKRKKVEERWLAGELNDMETVPRILKGEGQKMENKEDLSVGEEAPPFPWEYPARVNLKKSPKGRIIPDVRSSSYSSSSRPPPPWLREVPREEEREGREGKFWRPYNVMNERRDQSNGVVSGEREPQERSLKGWRSRASEQETGEGEARENYERGSNGGRWKGGDREESSAQGMRQFGQWESTHGRHVASDREEVQEEVREGDREGVKEANHTIEFGGVRGRGVRGEATNPSRVIGEDQLRGSGRGRLAPMAPWERREDESDYNERYERLQDDNDDDNDDILHSKFENRSLSSSSETPLIDENLQKVGIYRSNQEAVLESPTSTPPWALNPWGLSNGNGREAPGVSSGQEFRGEEGTRENRGRGHGLEGVLEGFHKRNSSSRGRHRERESFDSGGSGAALFPWEKEEKVGKEAQPRIKTLTLAELTLPPEELKRLTTLALAVKTRVKIGKAGVSDGIVEYCHNAWRTSEIVRVKCEGLPAYNMRQTAEELEKLTGGLIIWRSGGAAAIYRGPDYVPRPIKSLTSKEPEDEGEHEENVVVETISRSSESSQESDEVQKGPARERSVKKAESDVNEEDVTEGLGPKMENWALPGPIPVDADQLLGPNVQYFKPYRLLPYGVQPNLSNSEMTTLRHYAKKLPSHFMLGTNKGLEGLANAILQMWDRVELAKIKLKRGVPNTSNERIAEELKKLTGGTLLSRDKEYIILHRGKDFLPAPIAKTLRERHEKAQMNADEEEKARLLNLPRSTPSSPEGMETSEDSSNGAEQQGALSMAGSVEESLELQRRWQEFQQSDDFKMRRKQAAQAKRMEGVRIIERKLKLVLDRKERAAREVTKLNELLKPALAPVDQESITEEERYMFKKLGMRMKAYLELGKRGVFDGVVENMHLHWKHRELVKVICKEKVPAIVESTAQMLEYESGGILVCVEKIKKDFSAIVVYRGKNYTRPQQIRPKTLLTKRQALKRATEEQRRASLELHMKALEGRVAELRKDLEVAEELVSEGPTEISTLEVPSPPSQNRRRLSKSEMMDEKMKARRVRRLRAEEGVLYRAPPLRRLERLQLREEALRMGRKATFQMGRKNVFTGLAKQIRLAFLSRHLVKIGIKGRAQGTPVEAIVRQLEAATGGVFVSQEPNKIILYRGWPQQFETLEEAQAVPSHLAEALEEEDFEVEDDYSQLIEEPSNKRKNDTEETSEEEDEDEDEEGGYGDEDDDEEDDEWLYHAPGDEVGNENEDEEDGNEGEDDDLEDGLRDLDIFGEAKVGGSRQNSNGRYRVERNGAGVAGRERRFQSSGFEARQYEESLVGDRMDSSDDKFSESNTAEVVSSPTRRRGSKYWEDLEKQQNQ